MSRVYYRSNYPYSSSRSRAKGQFRAANEQRDATQVILNCDYEVTCGQTMVDIVGDNKEENFHDTGTAAINIFDVLRTSEFFNSYVSLYDQLKIDCIRAKIIATNWINGNSNDTLSTVSEYDTPKSYIICTAWDRSGLGEDQVIFQEVDKKYKIPYLIDGNLTYEDQVAKVKEMYTNIGTDITTYSSALTKHLGPGNAYQIVRQLYPSSVIEKEQYISTSLFPIQNFAAKADDKFVIDLWYNKKMKSATGNEYLKPTNLKLENSYPTNLLSDPSIKFKPTLLINVMSSNKPGVVTKDVLISPEEGSTDVNIGINKIKPVTFNIEFEIAVSFRGLRYNKYVK